KHQLKHFFYTGGWKKFEPLWNMVIQLKKLNLMTPLLEGVLSKVTGSPAASAIETNTETANSLQTGGQQRPYI
ncbi:MAG: hypothetical protein KDE51_00040, partial [Anaerolineales bacterium]|nr:hypothetical protein [Anaerolineales bacterium]